MHLLLQTFYKKMFASFRVSQTFLNPAGRVFKRPVHRVASAAQSLHRVDIDDDGIAGRRRAIPCIGSGHPDRGADGKRAVAHYIYRDNHLRSHGDGCPNGRGVKKAAVGVIAAIEAMLPEKAGDRTGGGDVTPIDIRPAKEPGPHPGQLGEYNAVMGSRL